MSLRISATDYFSGSVVIGNTGLGAPAESIPSNGDSGGSFLYNDLSLPADNGKEIRGEILSLPASGTLLVDEDGSFTFAGAADGDYSFTYQLHVDGVATGSPATVSMTVGAGGVVISGAVFVKVGGVYVSSTAVYAKVGGIYKLADQIYTKQSGVYALL